MGATITVYFNGAPDPSTPVVDSMGNWSMSASAKVHGVYSVKAQATNGFGTSGDSNTITITIDTDVAPATALMAIPGQGKIDLTWTASPDPDVIGYQVLRSPTGAPGTFVLITSQLVDDTAYCDSGLSTTQQYFYVVRAVDDTLQEN